MAKNDNFGGNLIWRISKNINFGGFLMNPPNFLPPKFLPLRYVLLNYLVLPDKKWKFIRIEQLVSSIKGTQPPFWPNLSIYITNKIYSQYKPDKIWASIKEAVKQPCLDQKIQCLYSYFLRIFWHKFFQGFLLYTHPNVTLKGNSGLSNLFFKIDINLR